MGKSLILVALWATLMVCFCFKQSLAQGTDTTVVPGANGSAVVDATITKIAQVEQASQSLLPNDRLLMRIAWVETEYGIAPNTYSDPNYHGGIWRVDSDMFERTLRMYNELVFANIFGALSSTLGISWNYATWADCRKPLYSGLAARLFLHGAKPVIPPGWAVQQQAIYWRDNYQHVPPTGNVTYFSERVSEIPGCKSKGIDLVFVMDASGSVGVADFSTSKTFVNDVVDYFEIGSDRTRVGVIQYSGSVKIEFHLNQYTNKSSLQQAIADISYMGGGTYTASALGVMANESFKEENGARGIGVPRVAVVITDGKSQGPDVRVPADRAREMDITIFAIGVTSNINEAELVAIANEPNDTFVFHVSDFDAISSIGATLQDTACGQSAVLPQKNFELNATIGQNQVQNFAQIVNQEGTTFAIQAITGILDMYGSATITNPNSALNDFHITAMEGQGSQEIFIGPEFFNRSSDDVGSRRRRQVTNQNDTEANSDSIGTVYITIEGKQATNDFSLVTAEGDVTEPEVTQPETTKVETTTVETTTVETTTVETTTVETTKPDNGGGTVTTTVPYIFLMMLNGVIIARLAISL